MDGDREYPSIGDAISAITKVVALIGVTFFLFSQAGLQMLFALLAIMAHATAHWVFRGV